VPHTHIQSAENKTACKLWNEAKYLYKKLKKKQQHRTQQTTPETG